MGSTTHPGADETSFEPHDLCLLLPDMSAEDFASLKADIQAHGLLHPILFYEDKILDGRHRARACAELGIVARYEPWTGADPVAFVLSENLHRRHLTPSQKAMIVAAAMDTHKSAAQARKKAGAALASRDATPAGQPVTTIAPRGANLPAAGKATATAAASVGVSARSVERAVKVTKEGTPEDVREVLDGKTTVKAKAAEIAARQPKPPKVPAEPKFPESARRAPEAGIEDAEPVTNPKLKTHQERQEDLADLATIRDADQGVRETVMHQMRLLQAIEEDSKKSRVNVLPDTRAKVLPQIIPPTDAPTSADAPPRTTPTAYLRAHDTAASHLAKVAQDLKHAIGSAHRTGVPIADALALLEDIRSTAEKLAASLAKRAVKEVQG